MAIIYSYPTVEPKLIDKILITQSYNVNGEETIKGNPTKSVKISSIGQLLGTTGTANTIPMFSTTGFKDSPISSAITGSGTSIIKASNVDRFIIDKPSGVTSGDPEYLISQDDVWKASFGWDDDGGGFGYLYNWSGGGWRFGAAGNNPAMTISTVAGSEGVTIENELAVQGTITATSFIGNGSVSSTGLSVDTTGVIQLGDISGAGEGAVIQVDNVEGYTRVVGTLSLEGGVIFENDVEIISGENAVDWFDVTDFSLSAVDSILLTSDLITLDKYGSGNGNLVATSWDASFNSVTAVAGGIQMADDTAAASAAKVGTLKYRISGNNSYVDMCMQTGAATYAWINIKQNNW